MRNSINIGTFATPAQKTEFEKFLFNLGNYIGVSFTFNIPRISFDVPETDPMMGERIETTLNWLADQINNQHPLSHRRLIELYDSSDIIDLESEDKKDPRFFDDSVVNPPPPPPPIERRSSNKVQPIDMRPTHMRRVDSKDVASIKRARDVKKSTAIDLSGLTQRQLESWNRVNEFIDAMPNLFTIDSRDSKPNSRNNLQLEHLNVHFEAATTLALWAGKEIGTGRALTNNSIRQTYNNIAVEIGRQRSIPNEDLQALRLGR